MKNKIKICPVCNEILYEDINSCFTCSYEFDGREKSIVSLVVHKECTLWGENEVEGWHVIYNEK